MKKVLLAGVLLIACALFTNAQTYENHPFDIGITRDFAWGEYDHSFFDMARYPKDPSAEAVVMKEFGKTWLTSNGNTTTLMSEYHVKIKLFTVGSLKRGHIEIPYYIQDNGSYEEINPTSVQGITYYATPDGGMRSVSLNPDSIFIVKKSKHWSAVVFTMPQLSKGCIIEYRYRFDSPFYDSFRKWEFQADIPKEYSEYEAHIPSVFRYNVSLRGTLRFSRDTVNIEKECFVSSNVNSDCSVEDYRIDNIPAFKAEPLMQSPKNYMSALYFQVTRSTKLNNFVNLNASYQRDVAVDWTNADYSLRYNDRFGAQLNHSSVIKDKVTQAISGITDTLEKAKAVYAFIQKNIAFDGQNSIYTDNGIKKALDKHTGNTADVNLALTAALNDAGIKAYAVITSTRENGLVSNNYPAVTEFNSVISFADINNKGYLLDATDPSVPFGMLPFKDLNDHGRVFPLGQPSYWKKLVTPQQRLGTTTADLTFDGSALSGTITTFSKSFSAYERRGAVTVYKPSGDKQAIPGLTITRFDNNATEQNPSLTETSQVQINNQGNAGSFTFVPFMLGKPVKQPFELLDTLTANPFVSETRNYSIDFGMPASYSFSVIIHLPAGCKIDNPPQNVSDSYQDIGSVNATFNADGNTVTYILTYSLDKGLYTAAEYAKLKTLFDKIILAEQASFTIKKQ